MGQACQVCGKKPVVGNQVTTRGRAKYLGGVGVKTTGISRRKFKPNLRTVRVSTPNGQHMTVRVCARCLRSGMVTKTVQNAPFKLPSAHPEKGKHGPVPHGEAQKAGQLAAPPGVPAEYKAPEGLKIRKRKRDKGKEAEPEQPEGPKE
jgi:large subunit ribosomal protein L28